MRRTLLPTALLLALCGTVLANGVPIDVLDVPVDPTLNGSADPGEWTQVNTLALGNSYTDAPGATPQGTLLFQKKSNWVATSCAGNMQMYAGPTFFLAHHYTGTGLAPYNRALVNEFADYAYLTIRYPNANVVELWIFGGFAANSPICPAVNDVDDPDDGAWVANAFGLTGNLLGVSPRVPGGGMGTNVFDDRGFLVRLNGNPASDRQWLPGMPQPGDPAWNWDDFFGIFARAGFNGSFGGPSSEVYEVAFHQAALNFPAPSNSTRWEIAWFQAPVGTLPLATPLYEVHFGPGGNIPSFPSAWLLLLAGALGLGGFLAFRRTGRGSVAAVLVLALLALPACGGSSGGGGPPKGPPAFVVPAAVLPNGIVNANYPVIGGPVTLDVGIAGGTAPFFFALAGGTLPPGLVIQPNGNLVGVPNTAGIFNFQYTVTDSAPVPLVVGTRTSLTIQPNPGLPPQVPVALQFLSADLQGTGNTITGQATQDVIGVVRVTGGDPSLPYVFDDAALLPNLPAPFTISPSGIIRGTPPLQIPLTVVSIRVTNGLNVLDFNVNIQINP
jgi:hypothetical protein